MQYILKFFSLFLLTFSLLFLHFFAYSENDAEKIYHCIFDFKFNKANEISKNSASKTLFFILQKQNLEVIEFFAKGNPEGYEKTKENLEKAEEHIAKFSPSTPEYGFVLAEIKILNAFLSVVYDEKLEAVFLFRQAYQILEKNIKKYPQYVPHYKSMGLLKTFLGAVPEKFRWALSFIGLEGSTKTGLKYIDVVIKSNTFYAEEASMYRALIYAYLLSENDKAVNYAAQLAQKSNAMPLYIAALVFYKCEKNDEALRLLNLIKSENKENFALNEKEKQLNSRYDLHFTYYLEADMLLSKGDYEAAENKFRVFLKLNKSENFIKETYFKILLARFLSGKNDYQNYFDSILENGAEHSDVDKHAAEFAKRGKMPDKTLISARLRTDGGYYAQALAEMQQTGAEKMRTTAEKTEFFYREGRIFHKLLKYDSAEISYKKCIETGETLPRYFAANAALQLGYIYKEILKDKEKAKFYFEKALSYPRHEYKSGIDQKANAALDLLN